MTLALRPLFKSFILIFWYPICDSLSILNHYPREDPRRSKRRSYLSCLRRVFKASLVPLQLPWKWRRNFREIGLKKREQRRFRVASSFRRQIFDFRVSARWKPPSGVRFCTAGPTPERRLKAPLRHQPGVFDGHSLVQTWNFQANLEDFNRITYLTSIAKSQLRP